MKEIWRDIKDYEEHYQVSNLGRVKSIKFKNIVFLKQAIDRYGYKYVGLCKYNKVKKFKVHRLVATEFIPNPYKKPQGNHIDGNKHNNNVDNLEWVTASENTQHAHDNKLTNKNKRKLTEEEIIKIFKSDGSQIKISEKYNVSRSVVNSIKRGRSWKNITCNHKEEFLEKADL